MKKISFIFLFIGLIGYAQTKKDKPVLKFEKTTIDYGTILKGSNGNRTFVFTNAGNAPVIINEVTSSCGCTIPKKPLKPIMPGEKGEIKVHYNTNIVGSFQKDIRIISNASINAFVVHIKGIVKGGKSNKR